MRWVVILITMIQLGCAGSQQHQPTVMPDKDVEALLDTAFATPTEAMAGEKIAGAPGPGNNSSISSRTTNNADQLLALSPEMKAFVDTIDPSLNPKKRFRRILRTLKMERFELEYDLDTTTTAAEAFAMRRGNCISFAALVVALAREVGLEAHFNQVYAPMERRAVSRGKGQLLVQDVLHINAEVALGWTTRVFEFNFEPRFNYHHEKLADATVQSLYLNNRALEMVKAQQLDQALALLNEALTLTPNTSLLWNSLGYVHRKSGNLELAEFSYTQALALDSGNTAAENNLRRVYELQSKRSLSQASKEPDTSGKGS